MTDGLVHRIRPAADVAQGALVLIHGRGADEHDLFPLLDLLDPGRKLLGIAPRGPLSLPPGGAHWYEVRQVGFPDPVTFHPTFDTLQGWLDGLLAEHGIPIDNTVLGGFSQGAVMTYALSFARGRPQPAAVVAFSGFIPTVDGLALDLEGREELPIAIGHGTYDPVITVDWGREAKRRLEEAGASPVYRESPMPHSIDPGFVSELASWIDSALQARRDRSSNNLS